MDSMGISKIEKGNKAKELKIEKMRMENKNTEENEYSKKGKLKAMCGKGKKLVRDGAVETRCGQEGGRSKEKEPKGKCRKEREIEEEVEKGKEDVDKKEEEPKH